jgi:hypothetical protein
MATVTLSVIYPNNKQAEVSEVFNKIAQNPDPTWPEVKVTGPFMWTSKEGAESFFAYEVANGKLYDAVMLLHAACSQYAGIEGYRYDVRVVATLADSEFVQKGIARLQTKPTAKK